MAVRLVCWLAPALAIASGSCGRRETGSREQGAPSASVVSIGVALGTCDDVSACEAECDGGSADRCRRLAASYAMGKGIDRDETRAAALYVRACDANDAPSCVFAGQMYEYAHGVTKDAAAATRFYERACDRDWIAGCYNLAIMLENGRGVPRDRARAAHLYERACSAGAKAACAKATELSSPAGVAGIATD
jgi:TPR repeat protein